MSTDSRHCADHHGYARRHRADHDATQPIDLPIHIGIFDDGVIDRMSAGQQAGGEATSKDCGVGVARLPG
jgi:hypothetical protein